MKKRIVSLFGLAFVLTGCYHAAKTSLGPYKTTSPQQSQESTAVESTKQVEQAETDNISYTDSGFSPKSIKVKVGTRVTWVNQSSGKMWVASAVHPTHQELPGFDQLEGSGEGTRYSYTFKEPGEWKYHNHLNPGMTGVVIVEE